MFLKNLKMLTVGLIGLASLNSSYAQEPSVLTLQVAETVIRGCVAHAVSNNQGVAVAVVDSSGSLISFVRMDGYPPGVGAFAIEKATAVAGWRFSTAQMEVAVQSTPGFANAPDIVTVAGGVPIYSNITGRFLGAIGVSGGAPAEDAACASAGIAAAELRETSN
ncbi:MAG: heme-binding protein [Pseudohongiellaceae bacterium]